MAEKISSLTRILFLYIYITRADIMAAVPPEVAAALEFLLKHEEVNQTLILCGFESPVARQHLIQREGFDSLDSFRDITDESVEGMARRNESYTPAAQRVHFGVNRINKMKAIIYWVRKCCCEGTPVDIASLNPGVVAAMCREKADSASETKRDDKLMYPPKFHPSKYISWAHMLENYLDSVKGQSKIPLSYIIRPENVNLDNAVDPYQRRIWGAPHHGLAYEDDNREVYHIYKDLMIDTDRWTWFSRAPEGDGRRAHLLISEHYRGTAKTAKRAAEADALLARLFYKGKTPTFMFETYVTRLREAFELLADNEQPLTGAQKVKQMLKGIICTHPCVTPLITAVMKDHLTNFEEASSMMSNVISQIFPAAAQGGDGRAKRQISGLSSMESLVGPRMDQEDPNHYMKRAFKKIRQAKERLLQREHNGGGCIVLRGGGGRWVNGVDISDPTRRFTANEWNRLRVCNQDYQWVIDQRNARRGNNNQAGHGGGRGSGGNQRYDGDRGGRGGGRCAVAFVEQQRETDDHLPANKQQNDVHEQRGGQAGATFGGRRYQQQPPRGPGRP
jgi:hypothetical protein